MANDEPAPVTAPAAAPAGGDHSPAFSFSIWPPTQRTRDAVVRRLVETLAGDTILCKRYGAVPAADAEPATRAIEAEAFDAAAAAGGGAAASVEEGIEALQFYSKEFQTFACHKIQGLRKQKKREGTRRSGTVKISQWTLARLKAEEAPKAAAQAEKKSKIIIPVVKHDGPIGHETNKGGKRLPRPGYKRQPENRELHPAELSFGPLARLSPICK